MYIYIYIFNVYITAAKRVTKNQKSLKNGKTLLSS